MRILTATQMREADRLTVEDVGIPARVLMESAGREVAAVLRSRDPGLCGRRVAIITGRGNNGGDGLVTARVLDGDGVDVTVFLIGHVVDVQGDARANLESFVRLGGVVVEVPDEEAWELHVSDVSACDVIVDALVGTGLRRPLSGMLETVVADVNAMGVPVVSIDLPSGLSADSHDIPGPAIRATATVALAAPTLPLVLPPAEALVGELIVADIGIPQSVIAGLPGPRLDLLTPTAMRAAIRPRAIDVHKGDMGCVVVVAGSTGKTGAARLAGLAALRSGAGLVTVATPGSCQATVASTDPEYLTLGLPEAPRGHACASAVGLIMDARADVLAIGPGLGVDPATVQLVRQLVADRRCPIVLDADGLNAFADEPGRLQGQEGRDLVITPHPGEMARLAGTTSSDIQANRLEVARSFAVTHRLTVVLKGHRTLIASPNGRVVINPTGNPGMASGGMGDVLTGMVAAWMAQLGTTELACHVAVYLHGLAGDLADARGGQIALIARDVIDQLGEATLELLQPDTDSD